MDQNTQKESRPPINLRIKFRSESIEQFIERYAVDVSRGGIFIRTREPLTVGTQLKLDFQFQNGSALMAGDGTVVWIREVDPNRTNVPPGMGVRFDKLTPESQAVLEQLLSEKTKRERSGVPGSGSPGAGGMAVRRPSSMFSVLEPPGAAAATEAQPTAVAAIPATAPAPGPQPPPSGPLAAVTSQLAAGLQSGSMTASPDDGEAREATGYRPLGATRNPFSGLAAAVPSSRPAHSEDSAPFDDINDEPTQIAGKLPSFLSDEDATVVAADAFGKSPKATGPRAPLPGIGRSDSPVKPKGGGEAEPPSKADIVGWNNALDQLLPSDKPVPQPTSSPGEMPPPAAADKDKPGAKSPEASAVPKTDALKSKLVTPSAPLGAQPAPAVATTGDAQTARSGDAKSAQSPTLAPVGTATATAAATRVAADGATDRRRFPAALIGVSVAVLAVAAIFLFRFFASQSTETTQPAQIPGPSGAPATVSAQPEAPSAAAPAPPTAAVKEPSGVPAPGSAGAAAPSTGAPSTTVAIGAIPPAGSPEASVRKVTVKRRVPRSAADSSPEAAVVPPAAAPKMPEPAPRGTPAGETAAAAMVTAPSDVKGESPSPTPGDAETAPHQVHVTSKPDGADITLDGQTVGKTPLSASIADITAPHFIAVRKDGFETFEQMISSSSAWSKTKAAKGKGVVQVLKINAKLKPVAGAGTGPAEARPATEPPAPVTDTAPKAEVVKPDRPMPPAEERPAAESAPK
jgi:uncharacterized protein (TIGR02266 family)